MLPCSVMNVIKVLAKVEEANQLGRQLPPEAFYNELIRCGVGGRGAGWKGSVGGRLGLKVVEYGAGANATLPAV